MSVSFSPSVDIIRAYDEGKSIENMDEYRGIVYVLYVPPTVAIVTGMLGKFKRAEIFDIFRGIHARGISYLLASRSPGHSLPGGQLIERGGPADGIFWEVNLKKVLEEEDARRKTQDARRKTQ